MDRLKRPLVVLALLLIPAMSEAQLAPRGSCVWRAMRGANTEISRREQWYTAVNDLRTFESRNPANTEALWISQSCTVDYRRQGQPVTLIETVVDTAFVMVAPPTPAPIPTPVPLPQPTPVPPPAPPSTGDLVVYPSAAVAFILGPQLRSGSSANPWPWFDSNAIDRGRVHGGEFPVASQIGDRDYYINLNYYDQGLVQYLNYYRTGDPAFLTYARKINDSWWEAQTASGTLNVESSLAPRNMSIGGLMLRALDGRPEMWAWITSYTRTMYQIWVASPTNNSSLYYGVRDGGYMLTYAAWIAAAHPNAAVRAEFQQKALTGARDYYARLQKSNGAWFWEDEGNVWEQPFMVGLLLDGMVATHRLTGDPVVRASILKAVDHIYSVYRLNDVVPERMDLRWRSVPYFVYPDGRIEGEINLAGGSDLNTIREGRQRNSLVLHAFGYAYELTKDAKYRTWGDEIFASTYGNTSGPLSDGMYGLGDFRAKEYNQAYRSAGRYLAGRL